MTLCQTPRATSKVISPLGKPLAWCPTCKDFLPAALVPLVIKE